MATRSTALAWRIPEMEEPGTLLSMGSHRVRHDCSNLAVATQEMFVVSEILLKSDIDIFPSPFFLQTNIFGTRDQLHGRQTGLGGDGLGMIRAHYIYCALSFIITAALLQMIRHQIPEVGVPLNNYIIIQKQFNSSLEEIPSSSCFDYKDNPFLVLPISGLSYLHTFASWNLKS